LLASLEAPEVASWTFSPTKLAPCLMESIVMGLGLFVWFGLEKLS
jgi:hypothetical protein